MLRVHLHAQVDNDNQGNESMKLRMKSWFLIVVVITMCMSTIGGTVAWFTDEVTSTANIVTSGNLKAGMQWTDGKQNPASADWQDASEGTIFEYTRWEPGVVQVRHLHVKNEGSLAFKYRLNIRAGADDGPFIASAGMALAGADHVAQSDIVRHTMASCR